MLLFSKRVMGSQEFWAWRVDIEHSLFWASLNALGKQQRP